MHVLTQSPKRSFVSDLAATTPDRSNNGNITAVRFVQTPLLVLLFAFTLAAPNASAQLPQIADDRLGVDLVQLTDGSRLYGFVLDRRPDGSLTIAIERKWLKSVDADRYEQLALKESEDALQARDQLVSRIETWLEERAEPGHLQRYLNLELEEARALQPPTNSDKLFFSATFSADQVRKVSIQEASRRQIAGIAYQHQLENVVISPASKLARQLREQGVNPETEQVDLIDELPQFAVQSARQWAARKALVEFSLREPLEYQGTGSTLIRKGAELDPTALIGQLLGASGGDAISQLGAELGLPEFTKPKESADWWKKITQAAERDDYHGVLITRLNQQLLSPVVTVEAHFFARESPGNWFKVVTLTANANANNQAADQLDRIKQDPQIQTVLGTLEALGLAADAQLDQALRHGAATETAMTDVRAEWNDFLELHTRSLNALPVPVSAP